MEDVEPYNSANVLYKLRPEDEWRQGVIQMRDNYEQQKYELLQLRGGYWPRYKDEIAVERMGAQSLGIGIGDFVIFKVDEKERAFPITGFIRHPFVPPPQFMDLAFFFMSGEGMQRFGVPEGQIRSVLCARDALQRTVCQGSGNRHQGQAGKAGYQRCRVPV